MGQEEDDLDFLYFKKLDRIKGELTVSEISGERTISSKFIFFERLNEIILKTKKHHFTS